MGFMRKSFFIKDLHIFSTGKRGKTDDDTVNMGFDFCFTVPAESPVGKKNVDSLFEQRFPENCDLLSLGYGVR